MDESGLLSLTINVVVDENYRLKMVLMLRTTILKRCSHEPSLFTVKDTTGVKRTKISTRALQHDSPKECLLETWDRLRSLARHTLSRRS